MIATLADRAVQHSDFQPITGFSTLKSTCQADSLSMTFEVKVIGGGGTYLCLRALEVFDEQMRKMHLSALIRVSAPLTCSLCSCVALAYDIAWGIP